MTSDADDGHKGVSATNTNSTVAALTPLPESMLRIPVSVQVVLGSVRMPVARLIELVPDTLITLDQTLGTGATVLANGREVARGDIVVLDDGEAPHRLAISITEILIPSSAV
jgi:flagellar motor switch protein FliN/FliY